jgi:hypothetical protein
MQESQVVLLVGKDPSVTSANWNSQNSIIKLNSTREFRFDATPMSHWPKCIQTKWIDIYIYIVGFNFHDQNWWIQVISIHSIYNLQIWTTSWPFPINRKRRAVPPSHRDIERTSRAGAWCGLRRPDSNRWEKPQEIIVFLSHGNYPLVN